MEMEDAMELRLIMKWPKPSTVNEFMEVKKHLHHQWGFCCYYFDEMKRNRAVVQCPCSQKCFLRSLVEHHQPMDWAWFPEHWLPQQLVLAWSPLLVLEWMLLLGLWTLPMILFPLAVTLAAEGKNGNI